MQNDIRIVEYDPVFKPQVARLQRFLWGPNVRLNTRYFEWKYEQNPYMSTPLVFLAVDGDEVIGMRGLSGTRWVGGGSATEEIRALYAGDFVIAPKYRGRWKFRPLMQAAEDAALAQGWRYLVNLSASPVTYLHSRRMGWKLANTFAPMRSPSTGTPLTMRTRLRLRKTPVLWRYANKLSDFASWDNRRFGNIDRFRADVQVATGTIVASKSADVDAMGALVAGTPGEEAIRHVRDREYYRWRFANPRNDYRFVYLRSGGELKGSLVLQARPASLTPYVSIVDWQAPDASVWRDLAGFATEAVAPLGLTTWTCGMPATHVAGLQEFGFATYDDTRGIKHYRPGLLVRNLGAQADATTSAPLEDAETSDWQMRMLYSDSH